MLKPFGKVLDLGYFKRYCDVPSNTATVLHEVPTTSDKKKNVAITEVGSSNQA